MFFPLYHCRRDALLNKVGGEVAQGGGLALELGPEKEPFALRHFDGNVFTYQPTGENAYGLSGVTFMIGADGKASHVLVENLDIYGQGTLTRRK